MKNIIFCSLLFCSINSLSGCICYKKFRSWFGGEKLKDNTKQITNFETNEDVLKKKTECTTKNTERDRSDYFRLLENGRIPCVIKPHTRKDLPLKKNKYMFKKECSIQKISNFIKQALLEQHNKNVDIDVFIKGSTKFFKVEKNTERDWSYYTAPIWDFFNHFKKDDGFLYLTYKVI